MIVVSLGCRLVARAAVAELVPFEDSRLLEQADRAIDGRDRDVGVDRRRPLVVLCALFVTFDVLARKFLGFSFWVAKGGVIRRRVALQAIQRMKERVRELTRRNAGRSLAQLCKPLGKYLAGWKAYFRLAETPGVFADLDQWVRHRLRAVSRRAVQSDRAAGHGAGAATPSVRKWASRGAHLSRQL